MSPGGGAQAPDAGAARAGREDDGRAVPPSGERSGDLPGTTPAPPAGRAGAPTRPGDRREGDRRLTRPTNVRRAIRDELASDELTDYD